MISAPAILDPIAFSFSMRPNSIISLALSLYTYISISLSLSQHSNCGLASLARPSLLKGLPFAKLRVYLLRRCWALLLKHYLLDPKPRPKTPIEGHCCVRDVILWCIRQEMTLHNRRFHTIFHLLFHNLPSPPHINLMFNSRSICSP